MVVSGGIVVGTAQAAGASAVMERRLTAILAADVVGYSRLMGANEVGTLQSLQLHQAELIEPEVAAKHGRIVKLTGDGMLVEFPSVVSAVECACAVQRRMRTRNADVPEDRRIEFRMGINLGDVIVQGDDLFGDGVNVAARLEGVARPGGLAISQSVRDHVGNKLDLVFRDKGDQQLKNIAHPVRVYDVVLHPGEAGKARASIAVDKPSIAVLPFTNMSGDTEQEYFSDGITEDIITDLSKISALFVVGRHTSFVYKGKSENLEQIAKELGVRFLLEGSVRKVGNRVRITGQLIDGTTGGHLWAERYDRDLTDIFAIQDEITRTIVDQLKVQLMPAENEAIGQPPTASIEAYTCYLHGRQFFHNGTKNFLRLAQQMFVRATELDPGFARAFAGIANCESRLIGWYGELIPEERVLADADKALALDPDLAEAHAARADALSFFGHFDEARIAFDRALVLDPNSFDVNLLYARFCTRSGNFEQSIPLYIRALELQPEDYQAASMLQLAFRSLGRDEESLRYGELAITRGEEAMRQHPEWSRPAQLMAATLAGFGRRKEAIFWLDRAIALEPDDSQTLYNAACTWAQLGEPDRAFDALKRWLPVSGVEKRQWLMQDCDFDPLRNDPRFDEILAQAEQSSLTA
jgi:adenylate cyclase